jgi:ABC-type dipeptide/oligopeptide/nickel transport system permease component
MIPVIIGVVILLFLALYIVPSDPAQTLVGNRPVPEEFREALNERYALDRPLPEQIGRYLGNLVRLDFGESIISRRPVRDILFERAPESLRLAAAGLIFLVILGIGSGMLSAVKRDSVVDGIVTVGTIVAVSVPVFVMGALLQIFVALKTRDVLGLPVTGLDDGLRSYILPGITLAAVSTAYLARVQRASLLETLDTEYVRAARARGLRPRRVLFGHAWRASLVPVVTYLGVDLGGFMGGAILTETVFNINGLGRTIALAIQQGDNQVVLAVTTFIVLVYLAMNLLVDLSYAALDPRIRLTGRRA